MDSGLWCIDLNDDDSEYIACGAESSLDCGERQLTVELWFNTDALSQTNRGIACKGAYTVVEGTGGWYLRTHSSDSLQVLIGDGLGSYTFNLSTAKIVVGTWQFWVCTVDESNLSWYINGAYDSAVAHGGAVGLVNTGNLEIGRDPGGGDHLDGKVALLRVYNRALSLAEIRDRYDATKHWFQ